MVISTKGRYALRLMIDLAQHCDEGFISLKTVSQRQDVSLKYMEAIAAAPRAAWPPCRVLTPGRTAVSAQLSA